MYSSVRRHVKEQLKTQALSTHGLRVESNLLSCGLGIPLFATSLVSGSFVRLQKEAAITVTNIRKYARNFRLMKKVSRIHLDLQGVTLINSILN